MLSMEGLLGRRVHIAGSASPEVSSDLLEYAHEFVRGFSRLVLRNGGGLVLSAGKEPLRPEAKLGLTFDWTVLEAALSCYQEGNCIWSNPGFPLSVVLSQKAEREFPLYRAHL